MFALPIILLALVPTIWIVDGSNGPGTNFTSMQAAVTAASSGDTLIVRPGTYAPFAVSGKALTIRGAGAASTFVSSPGTMVSVPPGTTFFLSGMTFASPPSTSTSWIPGIRVTGPGRVVIADASLTGSVNQVGGSGLEIQGGAVVHAARCLVAGGSATGDVNAGAGAWVESGCVLAADASTFIGGNGGSAGYGGNGLLVTGGTATLSRCNVTGGSNLALGGCPGAGVGVSLSGFVRIAGDATILIQGGAGPSPISIVGGPSATVIVNGPVTIVHPTSGPVATGAPALPHVSITGTPVGNGGELQATSAVTLTINGLPLAPYVCAVDATPSFSTAYSSLLIGELLIPVSAVPVFQGVLDATGMFQVSLTPSLTAPSLMDLPIYLQVGVADSTGQLRVSNGLVRVFHPGSWP